MADTAAWWGVGVSILSLFVSVGALVWANVSARASQKANNFQLHIYQKEIYLEYYKLWNHVQFTLYELDHIQVRAFNDYAKTSFLYFPKPFAKTIDDFHRLCWWQVNNSATRIALERTLEQYKDDPYSREQEKSTRADVKERWDKMMATGDQLREQGRMILEQLEETINIIHSKPSLWQRFLTAYNKPFDWDDKQEPQ